MKNVVKTQDTFTQISLCYVIYNSKDFSGSYIAAVLQKLGWLQHWKFQDNIITLLDVHFW